MGLLDARDKQKEEALLNPMARSLSASMTRMVKTKVLSALVNEQEAGDYRKKMFQEVTGEIDGVEFSVPAERTTHTSIPPAHVRIQKFQRK